MNSTYTLTDEYAALKERLGSDRWRELVTRHRADGHGNMAEESDMLRRELGSSADSIPHRNTARRTSPSTSVRSHNTSISPEWRRRLDAQIARTQSTSPTAAAPVSSNRGSVSQPANTPSRQPLSGIERVKAAFSAGPR